MLLKFCLATIEVCVFRCADFGWHIFCLWKGIKMEYFFIILCVVVIIVVIVFNLDNKAKKKKDAEKQEKIKKETEFIKKVKESPIVNNWADEISEYIAPFLNEYSYKRMEFHFRGYSKGLEFGVNLQSVWLPNLEEYISQDGNRSIKIYNFCQYGLPDLNSSGNQIELFSVAVADIVADKLNKQGHHVIALSTLAVVDMKGYSVAGRGARFGSIIYIPPKIQGEW